MAPRRNTRRSAAAASSSQGSELPNTSSAAGPVGTAKETFLPPQRASKVTKKAPVKKPAKKPAKKPTKVAIAEQAAEKAADSATDENLPSIVDPPVSTTPNDDGASGNDSLDTGLLWDGINGTRCLQVALDLRPKYDTGEGKVKFAMYTMMSSVLRDKFSMVRSAKQCANRMSFLGQRWRDRQLLLGESGMNTDAQGRITCGEAAWTAFVNKGNKAQRYNWHRIHTFPDLELTDLYFGDSRRANGNVVLTLEDCAANPLREDLDVSAEPGNFGNTEPDNGGKEAAAKFDPKKEYNQNKRFRHLNELTSKIGEVVAAFSQPLEVVDAHERAICKAMNIWQEEFGGVSLDIAERFYEEWQKERLAAVMFYSMPKSQRKAKVERICKDYDIEVEMSVLGDE